MKEVRVVLREWFFVATFDINIIEDIAMKAQSVNLFKVTFFEGSSFS